jgi:hypothetical protein
MPALPDLTTVLNQINHHSAWLLCAALWHAVRAIMRPIYRLLYVRVLEEIAPTVAKGVNAEIAEWFASRGQAARAQVPRDDRSSDHSPGDSSPPATDL